MPPSSPQRPARRGALLALAAVAGGLQPAASSGAPPGRARPDYPPILRGTPLRFPRDFGAHPDYRTEWWYATGWLNDGAVDLGFQITFFRIRPATDPRNPSRFAPHQVILAHAAISDPAERRLVHAERVARAGFGLAQAAEADTDVELQDWRLVREPAGEAGSRYRARIDAGRLRLALALESTQPMLLHGDAGYSRKGPLERQASHYYTQPQLRVSGRIAHAGREREVRGQAWLDHEWSSEILAPGATGWDWTGINLADGGALMAFRIRGADGATIWAGGTLRDPAGRARSFGPEAVSLVPMRSWRSARTGASYPVSMRVRVGEVELTLEPLFDDQELDARTATGIVYWEGAVRASAAGVPAGRGYLELTGYDGRLVL
jgi:predicted secreted hydrolase